MSGSQGRWSDRRLQAWLIRAAVFVVPVIAAIVVATVVANVLPEPNGLLQTIGWWTAVIGGSFVAMWLVDRMARRLLPLAALLRMSLVFPDKAPSRFSVALRSYSSKRMQAEVARARAAGVDDNPTKAAEFVLALVASLGSHDRKTRGHAERTRAYTDLLAEELGVAEADRDRLRWAALLHDVGKLGVPAEVLNADHVLTDEDWSHINHHPRDGYELTRPIHPFLGAWAETILHHHERYDGTGYPQGIAGENIAYGARIVAVGDAYDAMTAHRTYQPALSTAVARRELAEGAGTQFDPHIVRAFLSLSMGSLRRVAGPLAFLGQIPFIGGIRRLTDTATAVVATSAALAVSVVTGVVPGLDETPPPVVVVAAESSAVGDTGAPNALGTESGAPPETTTTVTTSTTTTSTTTTTTTTVVILAAPPPPRTPPSTTTTTTTLPPTTTTLPPTTTTLPPWYPTALADVATTAEDVATVIAVLANDSDRDGDLDPDSLRIQIGPTIGVAVASDGAINYTPRPDSSGSDSLTYEVCDAGGRCSSAPVSITVTAVNDAPVANDDTIGGAPWGETTIDVLANDTDIDGGTLVIASHDTVSALGGSVSCVTTCSYTPPEPWTGVDTFEYIVSDGLGGTDVATVSVTNPAIETQFFLHATGPGDQASTPVLPLTTDPTVTNEVLPNYDIDRDADPGLLLLRGEGGPPDLLALTDPTRFQLWSLSVDEDLIIGGNVSMRIWAGMSALEADLRGRLQLFMLDCPATTVDGTDCIEITRGNVNRNPWSPVEGQWEPAVFDLGPITYTIPATRALTLKLTVAAINSDDDMRLAFDAVGFESGLIFWSS